MSNQQIARTIKLATQQGFKAALKTAWWMIRITVIISFCVMLLQYFGVIEQISKWLTPLFKHIGLQGEAALVFISGALVNIYAAVATIETIGFDSRSITILALMCLCAHNLILETAIQKKTGSSALRMVIVRLVFAFLSAYVLNLVLPKTTGNEVLEKVIEIQKKPQIWTVLLDWTINTFGLVLKMFTIIVTLTVLQRVLAELGVIRWISKFLRWPLKIFGLPAKTSFLWIVSQTLGLAYGAAVMIEEKESGKVDKKELDLLNHHIAVSHSNVEDLLLFVTAGASAFWALLLRLIFAIVAVWERRLELKMKSSSNFPEGEA